MTARTRRSVPSGPTKFPRLSVTVQRSTLDALVVAAAKLDISVSALVDAAVTEYLAVTRDQPEP